MNGYSDSRFGAQDSILREQLVTMLYRYEYQQRGLKNKGEADLSDYSDGDMVEDYAREPFSWAIDNGIITGYDDGTLNPRASASRAETAAAIFPASHKSYTFRSYAAARTRLIGAGCRSSSARHSVR